MSKKILEASGLSVTFKSYGYEIPAVKNVDFHLNDGEVVGVVGESGSGKSTLARVLAGLQIPTTGQVLYQGEPIQKGNITYPGEMRKAVQMVFQDPYSSLNPRMRVLNAVVEAIVQHQTKDKKAAEEIALKLLKRMGISEVDSRKYPNSLSGGQRQRVSVARALSAQPKVLIADEPTSAIDQSAQSQLLELFTELIKDGLSIILISHDLGVIRYLSDRVYVMESGVFVESGATSDIFHKPQNPYTQKLIASIPK
ncbi:MAG: ABC transporter ATP-binding protein [Actinobacteria bacterium]|nr:ABC transporter ATP-binding protein [Actinomycetota bacterium]NCX35692.1 ABC transporter ATP-binding protein [Actinomycetota bacterium]NDA39327.1 ABC transporter ATP-binding protein [Actinomycetota bacterium]